MPSDTLPAKLQNPSDPWRWQLRLFTSADLVGSTSYKLSNPNWSTTFREFFREFPLHLKGEYHSFPQVRFQQYQQPAKQLEPWKFLGDEVLFSVELERFEHIASHVLAFKKSVCDFPSKWRKSDISLCLKGTAWIAGFPVTNRQIELEHDGFKLVDYIGPSIDAGFRVAKNSNERWISLTADLALMLMDAVDKLEWDKSQFSIRLLRKEVLKGVIGSVGYPVIQLHIGDGTQNSEERVLNEPMKSNWSDLQAFLRQFLDSIPSMNRPFISGDTDSKYGEIPDAIRHKRTLLVEEENNRGYDLENPAPDPVGDVKDLPPPDPT
jgi:hypothetical protein